MRAFLKIEHNVWRNCRYYWTQPIKKPNRPHDEKAEEMIKKINRVMGGMSQSPGAKEKKTHVRNREHAVIAAKHSKYNHYLGEPFDEKHVQKLASHGWKHIKSKGDYFTINSIKGIPAYNSITKDVSFSELGISDILTSKLQSMSIENPVAIQVDAIPDILKGKNLIFCAETGSGKTLTYLLPILQQMSEYNSYQQDELTNRPRCVILVPSRELVEQIESVTKALVSDLPFKVKSICGGRGTGSMLKYRNKEKFDILIATPGILSKLVRARLYNLNWCQHLVIDEADSLMDDSFSSMVTGLVRKIGMHTAEQDTKHGSQVLLVGATIPKGLQRIIGDVLPIENISQITTPYVHKLLPHVSQKFIRVGPDDRPATILKRIKSNINSKTPTLVFCNKTATSNWLGHFFESNNVEHTLINGLMPEKIRRGRFDQFQSGDVDVLVATDIASRGLDTLRAKHVVNYEFPGFISDYIHRVGRIGRLGSHGNGQAISYISYKWDVELLWKIETAARKNAALFNVNANIKRKLVGRHQEDDEELILED